MNFAKRLLMVAGAVALAGVLGVLLAPKAAHGIAAALVQVTNTSANPVPVALAVTKTVTVANLNRDIACGTTDDEGPFDVSSYSTIRFIAVSTFGFDPATIPIGDSAQFQVNSLDSNGNPFALDTLTAGPSTGGIVTISAVYQMPGTSVQVHISPVCQQADVIVHLTILGR